MALAAADFRNVLYHFSWPTILQNNHHLVEFFFLLFSYCFSLLRGFSCFAFLFHVIFLSKTLNFKGKTKTICGANALRGEKVCQGQSSHSHYKLKTIHDTHTDAEKKLILHTSRQGDDDDDDAVAVNTELEVGHQRSRDLHRKCVERAKRKTVNL